MYSRDSTEERLIRNNIPLIINTCLELTGIQLEENWHFKEGDNRDLNVYLTSKFGKQLLISYNKFKDEYDIFDYNSNGANRNKGSHHFHLQKSYSNIYGVFSYISTLHNPKSMNSKFGKCGNSKNNIERLLKQIAK